MRGIGGPLRILLLSDLHLERWTRRESRVLEAARAGRPDAILIAGDYFNLSYVGEPGATAAARALLEGLIALAPPAGVFAVRGTVAVDPRAAVHALVDGLALRLLEDELAWLEHGAARLQLLGVSADGSAAERRARLVALAASSDAARPRLCLHHTPDLVEEAARLGLALYLAGHTHGGQICVPLLGALVTASRFGRRYARGLHRLEGMVAYVSRGLGLEGLGAPRMRFLARPELVWLELAEPAA
jgi:predicted MPP superfamily phosphohydrolase